MQGDWNNGIKNRSRKVSLEVLESEAQERLLEVQLAAIFELVNRLP
jgi:hypothetical protein